MATSYNKAQTSGEKESRLRIYKDILISDKDYIEMYTRLVHSESYRLNVIKNVINYIPFVLNEDGEPTFDANKWSGHPVGEASSVYRAAIDKDGELELDDIVIPPSQVMDLYDEDNTLSEIISQKLTPFLSGKIIPSLNTADANYQKFQGNEQFKGVMTNFANSSVDAIKDLKETIKLNIENSKWYPYSGVAYIPLAYNTKGEEELPNHRKINITPFNSGFDGTSNKLKDAEWAVFSEKITFNEFKDRVMKGEYSSIKFDKRSNNANANSDILKIWNREGSYEYVTKDFYEQAVTRNTSLRLEIPVGKEDATHKMIETNMYGAIDYVWSKNVNGEWTIDTFLNGDLISETVVDNVIDEIPVVLWSESTNIENNLDYMGNISFKLLPLQNTILNYNYIKKNGIEDMAPVVINNYVADETEAEQSEDVTKISTANNKMSMVTVQVKNTNQANNLARVMLGSQVYIQYLQGIDQFIMSTRQDMNVRAGITDFMQGTAASAIQSKSGIDEMKITGLSKELDVVNSIKHSLTKLAITEAYFRLVSLNSKQKSEKDATGIVDQYRSSYKKAVEGYSNIFSYDFETEYQKQFTQTLLQSTLLPLSMQSGHADIALDLLQELPLTNDMKKRIKSASDTIKERMSQQEEAQQQQQEQEQAQSQQGSSSGKSTSKDSSSKESSKEPSKKKTETADAKKSAKSAKPDRNAKKK